jgi:predicted nucleic acid-binding protein
MKIYIDTCGWSRKYDDQTISKNAREADAIIKILQIARCKGFIILGSVTLDEEIGENEDAEKLVWVTNLYRGAITERVTYKKEVFDFLEPLGKAAGIDEYDVFHLCYAESSGADFLLTTDKKFLNRAKNVKAKVQVMNPLTFLQGGFI